MYIDTSLMPVRCHGINKMTYQLKNLAISDRNMYMATVWQIAKLPHASNAINSLPISFLFRTTSRFLSFSSRPPPISFLSRTSSSDFFPFPHVLPDFIGHTRSCLPNFRNRHLWPHMSSQFSAKIMLRLGFDLWSAGN